MATDSPMIRDGSTFTASADLSAKQFYAVVISGSRTVGLAAANAGMRGILQNKPTSGQAADICIEGVCKAIAGGTITAGNKLQVDLNGKLIANTTGADAYTVAVANESAVAGDIFSISIVRIVAG